MFFFHSAVPSNDQPNEPLAHLTSFLHSFADCNAKVEAPSPYTEGYGNTTATLTELGPACVPNEDLLYPEETCPPEPPSSSLSSDDYEDDGVAGREDDHGHHGYRRHHETRGDLEEGEIEEDREEDPEDDDEEENTTPRRNQNITPKRRQFNVSESMYKSVLVHSASKRLQETLWEEMRKEDEMNGEELPPAGCGDGRENDNIAGDSASADCEAHELPEELVDSLGMISLANAAELHRGGQEGEGEVPPASPQPLPPASTLLNLSAGPEQVVNTYAGTTTTSSFASPIEVITSDNHVREDHQLDLAGQISQLANYSQALGHMPATAFDYLRLYDSQVLNSNSVILDGERHDQNGFPSHGFYDFPRQDDGL